jgi:hypothetical protein
LKYFEKNCDLPIGATGITIPDNILRKNQLGNILIFHIFIAHLSIYRAPLSTAAPEANGKTLAEQQRELTWRRQNLYSLQRADQPDRRRTAGIRAAVAGFEVKEK